MSAKAVEPREIRAAWVSRNERARNRMKNRILRSDAKSDETLISHESQARDYKFYAIFRSIRSSRFAHAAVADFYA